MTRLEDIRRHAQELAGFAEGLAKIVQQMIDRDAPHQEWRDFFAISFEEHARQILAGMPPWAAAGCAEMIAAIFRDPQAWPAEVDKAKVRLAERYDYLQTMDAKEGRHDA